MSEAKPNKNSNHSDYVTSMIQCYLATCSTYCNMRDMYIIPPVVLQLIYNSEYGYIRTMLKKNMHKQLFPTQLQQLLVQTDWYLDSNTGDIDS